MILEEVLFYARKNISLKKYKDVINLLEEYRLIYKEKEDLLLELGKAYFLSNDFYKAKKCFNKILKLNKKNIYAMELLAKIYLKDNKTSKVIRTLENIIKTDGFYVSAQNELINVFLNNDKYSNIIKYYDSNLIKNNAFVYYAISLSYIKLGKKNKALEIIKKFLKAFDKNNNKINESEIFNLARIFAEVDEYETVVDLCNLLDIDYKKINNFYNTIHFSFSKYLQNLRIGSIKNNNFVIMCNILLDKIPDKVIKIRNIILNEMEIYKQSIYLKSKPRYATFVLTTKCNLRCKMCNQPNINWYMNDKQVEQIKKLIPYLQYATWHGGEVFFHKKFWELFEFAKLHNVEQEIITNGTLIKDWMLDKLLNSKLQLTLSIDAVNKIDYESIRVGSDFNKIIDLLEKLKNKRKEVLNDNFILKLNVIVSKINYKNINTFVDFANNYDINKIYFFPLNGMDAKSFYNEYNEIIKYLDKNMNEVIKKADDLGIEIETNLPRMCDLQSLYSNSINDNKHDCIVCKNNVHSKYENKKLFCVVPWQRIRVDENIRPYCFCKENVGNFNENFNILNIWNNRGMRSYREKIKNNDYILFCNSNCLEVSSKVRKEFKGIILE